MQVTVVDHPLVKHKLGLMRRHDISTKDFRELASEIARLLTYEATRDLPTEPKVIQGWAGPVNVEKIKGKKITVVPIFLASSFAFIAPISVGTGYVTALLLGVVNFQAVREAALFAWPDFTLPVWNREAVVFIVPVAIAPAIEHFGDILAIGSITDRDYLEDPGIHRTLLGDGVATSLASLLGGPPDTTYSLDIISSMLPA